MSITNLPTYLPLHDAAEQYSIEPHTLKQAIESGKVRAAKNANGEILVAKEDVGVLGIEVQLDLELRGNPIRVTEAAEKYRVDHANLSRWSHAGYIRILKKGPKLLLLDEADVKRATEIFRHAQQTTGSPIRAGWILKRTLRQTQT